MATHRGPRGDRRYFDHAPRGCTGREPSPESIFMCHRQPLAARWRFHVRPSGRARVQPPLTATWRGRRAGGSPVFFHRLHEQQARDAATWRRLLARRHIPSPHRGSGTPRSGGRRLPRWPRPVPGWHKSGRQRSGAVRHGGGTRHAGKMCGGRGGRSSTPRGAPGWVWVAGGRQGARRRDAPRGAEDHVSRQKLPRLRLAGRRQADSGGDPFCRPGEDPSPPGRQGRGAVFALREDGQGSQRPGPGRRAPFTLQEAATWRRGGASGGEWGCATCGPDVRGTC